MLDVFSIDCDAVYKEVFYKATSTAVEFKLVNNMILLSLIEHCDIVVNAKFPLCVCRKIQVP